MQGMVLTDTFYNRDPEVFYPCWQSSEAGKGCEAFEAWFLNRAIVQSV